MIKFISKLSLKYKIILPTVLTILVALGVFSAYLVQDQLNRGESRLAEKAAWVAELLADSSVFGVWDMDEVSIQGVSAAFFQDKEIVFLKIYGQEGEVFASLSRELVDSKIFSGKENIVFQHEIIGKVEIDLSNHYLIQNINLIKKQLLILTVIIFFIAAVITTTSSRFALQPLNLLMTGVHKATARDFQTSITVKSEDELGRLTMAFNQMSLTICEYQNHLEEKIHQRTQELEAANIQLSDAMSALWGEMALAKKIQTVLVPEAPCLRGFEVCASLRPAEEVGGDYYDVIHVKDSSWIVIGDVSGHGVSAGLIMMMVQTAIHTVLLEHPTVNTAELLTIINRTITLNIEKMGEEKYMTIMVLSYNTNNEFFYAGLHEDIIIYRSSLGQVESIESSGMWLGIVPDIAPMLSSRTFQLQQNDVMLLYTDGVTEAMDKDGEMLDTTGLAKILGEHGEKSAAQIHETILEKIKDYKVDDDVALLILKKE